MKLIKSLLNPCRSLDLSFNDIHHISHLSHLANLHTLYLVQNKISRVRTDDLAPPLGSTLKSLELGGNRIRVLENIGHLHQLEELWVGKNKITKLEVCSSSPTHHVSPSDRPFPSSRAYHNCPACASYPSNPIESQSWRTSNSCTTSKNSIFRITAWKRSRDWRRT